jgi:hypothetical protein
LGAVPYQNAGHDHGAGAGAATCRLGGNVTYIQLEAAPLYVAWIRDLIAGK